MKYGLIIAIGLIIFSCRSTRSSHRDYDRTLDVRKESVVTRKDSTTAEAVYKDSTATASNVFEYSRTTTFGDAGRVSSVQEQWRRTGSSGVSVSTGRTSEVSVNNTADSTDTQIKSEARGIETSASTTDTRPVQGGSEWFGVTTGIGVLLLSAGIIVFIICKKRKK
jgi:hypothetical protein